MKIVLILCLLILSCSVENDSNEIYEEYALLKQTKKLNIDLGLYRSSYFDGKIYGYGFPGLKYLDIISGETSYLKIKWQDYNNTSSYLDYSFQVMETYVRNDSLFALGRFWADNDYLFYCYYIDLENGIATLYKGDNVALNRVIYNTILNGNEISISDYGEAYVFDEQLKKWLYLEDFDSWCYVHSVTKISVNEMLYTCGTELRKISVTSNVSGEVLFNSDSLWKSIVYRDADDGVNLIVQNSLYELLPSTYISTHFV